MREICRFLGVIVRRFEEPGAPYQASHFHAYYQVEVAVYGESLRLGPSSTRKSPGGTGSCSRTDAGRVQSNPCGQGVDLAHPIFRVESFKVMGDPVLFRQVRLDPEMHTLVWPNGADFDPAALHDWPEHVGALEKLARRWESRAA